MNGVDGAGSSLFKSIKYVLDQGFHLNQVNLHEGVFRGSEGNADLIFPNSIIRLNGVKPVNPDGELKTIVDCENLGGFTFSSITDISFIKFRNCNRPLSFSSISDVIGCEFENNINK